jgi:hypothetical protein
VNAFLLMGAALVSGNPAPACGGCDAAPACGCEKVSLIDKIKARMARPSCGGCEAKPACDPCASKPSLLDKLRAKFAKPTCGCETSCETSCKPACGTPLLSKPVFHGFTTSCGDSCNSCGDTPTLLEKLKAKFASRKHCGCDTAPACGGCGSAAPAGCALPPAPGAAPAPAAPADAPKTMPKPVEAPKKTSSLTMPTIVTPASNFVPSIPAPAPTPMPAKSAY